VSGPRPVGHVTPTAPDREAFIASPLPIERQLRELFPRLDARVVLDVGSCEGEDAIRYATLFPSAAVYAFEPLPKNVRLVEENLARHPHPNIRVVPLALSDSTGTARFFVSSGQPDGVAPTDWDYGNKSSSLLPPARHLDVHPWVRFDEQIEVSTETLETFCRGQGITEIDVVHLDVQGAELAVLRGAGPLLDRVSVVWMEVEAIPLYDGQPLKADVERFMTDHGFRRIVDTVDAVAGDQLYVNTRIFPTRPAWRIASARASTTCFVRRAGHPFRRAGRRLIRPLHGPVLEPLWQRRSLAAWQRDGRPVPPPPAFKRKVVRAYGRRYGLGTMVESGTYFGDMVEAQRRTFGRVVSIELSPELWRSAADRFASVPNVTILQGDSTDVLPRVLADLGGPCLFWLDGHYSAGVTARGDLETPVWSELEAILDRRGPDVVLIDDARCFGEGDYPSIDAIRALVADRRPDWSVAVADDIIRIHGPRP
jgi:FkbM family methyltransferase